jgi:hypothetical protein
VGDDNQTLCVEYAFTENCAYLKVEAGRNEFLTEVNRIFAQNGLVLDL